MTSLHQTKLTGPDLIDWAISQTPEEELTPINKLWMRDISVPDLPEILSYPALCLSKKLGYVVEASEGGYKVMLATPSGTYDTEHDLIEWTTEGRGTLRHQIFASRVTTCGTDNEHYARATIRHCARPSCPVCAPYHIARDTPAQALKIYAKSRDLKHTDGWRAGYLQHVTVSVPEDLYYMALTTDGYKTLKKRALEYAQKAGVLGGLIVFHPFRQNGVNSDDDLPEEYTPTASNDLDKKSCRFAPHFHIVGFGFVTKTAEIYDKTGWVIKALRTRDKKITSVPEISGIIAYLKSHAGIISENSPSKPERMQTIAFFGACGPNAQALIGHVRIYTPQICPECGAPLRAYHVHGANGDTSLLGNMEVRADYPIFTTRAKAGTLRAFLEDNKGDPLGVLQHLDRHPTEGYGALSNGQLSRMLQPMSVKCLDGSLHCIQSEASIKIHYPRSRKKDPQVLPEISPPEISGSLPEASEISEDLERDRLDFDMIDYHLPPEVDPQIYPQEVIS